MTRWSNPSFLFYERKMKQENSIERVFFLFYNFIDLVGEKRWKKILILPIILMIVQYENI